MPLPPTGDALLCSLTRCFAVALLSRESELRKEAKAAKEAPQHRPSGMLPHQSGGPPHHQHGQFMGGGHGGGGGGDDQGGATGFWPHGRVKAKNKDKKIKKSDKPQGVGGAGGAGNGGGGAGGGSGFPYPHGNYSQVAMGSSIKSESSSQGYGSYGHGPPHVYQVRRLTASERKGVVGVLPMSFECVLSDVCHGYSWSLGGG